MVEGIHNPKIMDRDLTSISDGRVIEGISPLGSYKEGLSRYEFASNYAQNGFVLDIGGGTGFGANHLKQTSKGVVCIEFDRKSIEYGNKRYSGDNLVFVQADAAHLPFRNNYFNVITAFLVFEHISEHDSFCQECMRVLKTGGFFIGATPNKNVFNPLSQGHPAPGYELGKTPHLHFKEFRANEFQELLSKYFSDVSMYGQNNLKFGTLIRTFIRTQLFKYGKVVLSWTKHGDEFRNRFRRRYLDYNKGESQNITDIKKISKEQISDLKDSFFKRSKHLVVVARK